MPSEQNHESGLQTCGHGEGAMARRAPNGERYCVCCEPDLRHPTPEEFGKAYAEHVTQSPLPESAPWGIVIETVNNREVSLRGPDENGIYDLCISDEHADEYAWITAADISRIGAWINANR